MVALVCCMFVAACTQGQYAVSVYSGSLKTTLELTQDQLDTITTFPYFTGLVTFTLGWLSDRRGPGVAVSFGCLLLAPMLCVYWAVATQRIAVPAVPALVCAMLLASYGTSSRRPDCHFADMVSGVLLQHLLKGEGDAAE